MDFVTARFASGGSTTEVTEADLRQTARKAKKAHKNRSAPAQASAPSSALAILGSVVMIGAVVGAASYLMPSAPKTEVIQNNQNVYVVKPDTTVASNNVQPLITHQIPTMQVRQPATVDVMDIPQVRHYSNQLAKEHGWNYMQQCTEPNTATQLRGHRRLMIGEQFCKEHLSLAFKALGAAALLGFQTVAGQTDTGQTDSTGTNVYGTTPPAGCGATSLQASMTYAAVFAGVGFMANGAYRYLNPLDERVYYGPNKMATAGGDPQTTVGPQATAGGDPQATAGGDPQATAGGKSDEEKPEETNDESEDEEQEDENKDIIAQAGGKDITTAVKSGAENKAADEGGNNAALNDAVEDARVRRARSVGKPSRDTPKKHPDLGSDDESPRHKKDAFLTEQS
eukprot:GHVT01010102.1.p1 GENE.GHVT01010102.1~~GHVT01010102.1.p1  ORF type:complete len:397 (+),score=70.88 GHVT01010102.1:1462-2652(+)